MNQTLKALRELIIEQRKILNKCEKDQEEQEVKAFFKKMQISEPSRVGKDRRSCGFYLDNRIRIVKYYQFTHSNDCGFRTFANY